MTRAASHVGSSAPPTMSYMDFLTACKAAGDKFPFLWKKILCIAQDAYDGYQLMLPSTPVPDAAGGRRMLAGIAHTGHDPFVRFLATVKVDHIPIDPATTSAEQHLVASLTKANTHMSFQPGDPGDLMAIGNGDLFKKLWAFALANPQLLTFLLSLLGIKLPVMPVAVPLALQP